MGWRTIYIENASKLSLNLDNLQVRYQKAKYNINLSEIQTIIIEDYTCVITCRLLAKLCEEGINVIFTKNNKMPVGALHGFHNNSRTAKISRIQLDLSQDKKKYLWQEIIQIKILGQANVLKYEGKEDKYLRQYVKEVEPGDISNKEGQAARVYFKELFGEYFVRFEEDIVNYTLNFTYQVIRSKVAQSIIDKGMHPSFGLFHKGEYNYFNLADDLLEPYRPIVDYYIVKLLKNYDKDYLTPTFKHELTKVLNYKVQIGKKKQKLSDSIDTYITSVFSVYEGSSATIQKYPTIIHE